MAPEAVQARYDASSLSTVLPSAFAERLAVLCQDRAIRRFAMKLARNRELAEDAIQEAYYAVSRVADPARIKDLRKYFCRALRNQVMRQSGESCARRPAGDVDALLAVTTAGGLRPSPRSSTCEEIGIRSAQEATWLRRLHGPSAATVPGRSADPREYRHAIADVAHWALCTLMEGDISTADMNDMLISWHSEWFTAGGSSPNTCQKRLSRARQDVYDLLASVISLDELLP
jgi:hypothetical protein